MRIKLILAGLVLAVLAPSTWADVKISDLPAGAALTGVEPTPVVQSGVTVQTTPAAISTYVESQLTSADIRGLWTGTCSAATFLRGDGACASAAPTPAALTKTDDTNVTLTLGGSPTTALLNAASITAGWTGQLSVARGGTGAAMLTGYTKGNGTSAFTASATIPYSDLTGTPAIPAAANPTASVGLAAVNGSASTFMRSDGSPPLDVSIAPTWTGAHTFTNASAINVSNSEPRVKLTATGGGTDGKLYDIDATPTLLSLRTRTDADGAGVNILTATRTASSTAVTNVSLGNATNNPTGTWLGTGTFTFGGGITTSGTGSVTSPTGSISGGRITVTGSTVPTNGMYLPTTNTVGLSTNSTLRLQVDSAGQVALQTVGAGISIKEGTNAKMGTVTLVAGTATVSTTAVTANSRIFLTAQSLGTVTVGQGLAVSARTAGTSFTIVSASPTDTSVVAWIIFEPS